MSRIADILVSARDTLADSGLERWSDTRLLRLVSEAQEDIAVQTRLLKGEIDIPVIAAQAIYDLPADVWLITRASVDKCVIPLHTHDELDELVRTRTVNQQELYYTRRGTNTKDFSFANFCWELEEAIEVEAIIYDRREMDKIRVFPIPLGDTDSVIVSTLELAPTQIDLFGVTVESTGATTDIIDELDSLFGVISGASLLVTEGIDESPTVFGVVVSYTNADFDPIFGTVSDIVEPDTIIDLDTFGVTYSIVLGPDDNIHLWYIRIPAKITTVLDELDVAAMWDKAIKYYVIAHAFDDDFDTKFEAKSAKALALYERELRVARKTDFLDGVRSSQYRSDYRGAFE